ncbi:MAG: hypothetical protein K0R67_2825 [Paenibacillus sp.]|jgi:hypothetical protein|nr:hypothetical protein [Paenibacillus sp.]
MRLYSFWKHIRGQREERDEFLPDKQRLMEEVRIALQEWKNAQYQLDYAFGQDEIDYAIYALEAAEKRYEMLLRKAKHQKLHVLRVGYPKAMEG